MGLTDELHQVAGLLEAGELLIGQRRQVANEQGVVSHDGVPIDSMKEGGKSRGIALPGGTLRNRKPQLIEMLVLSNYRHNLSNSAPAVRVLRGVTSWKPFRSSEYNPLHFPAFGTTWAAGRTNQQRYQPLMRQVCYRSH